MRRLVTLCLILTGSILGQTPNLSGVWDLKPSSNQSTALKIKIDHGPEAIVIVIRSTSNGQTEQTVNTFIPGRETKGSVHGAAMTSNTAWEGNVLVIHSLAMFGRDELRMTDYYSVAAHNTLTFREVSKFASEPERDVTRLFDRKPDSYWEPDAPPKPAEEVYKNIRILKGLPAPQVQGFMANFTRSLGVECAYCHVPGAFDRDDKPTKTTARGMFTMMRGINQNNFGGSDPVTCWTCHRGAAKPEVMPK